jgi:phosphohistidine phosphatase
MRVWVIRHAQAESQAGRHDHERALSASGTVEAQQLARYLQRRSMASVIISSPILRARQTAEAIKSALARAELRYADAVSTGGSAQDAIEALRRLEAPEVIIVSHEPLTSQLTSRLAAGADVRRVQFKPATAVLLDVDAPLGAGHGLLIESFSPETLHHASGH